MTIECNVKVEFQSPNGLAVTLTYNGLSFGFHPHDMSEADRLKLIHVLSQPKIKLGRDVV